MKKPQKPWRLLGFRDLHLFRSLWKELLRPLWGRRGGCHEVTGGVGGRRGWDFSLPFRKHSRAASVRQARLAALLVFVTRLQKGRTASFLPRSPTPSAAAKRLRRSRRKSRHASSKREDHPSGWSSLLLGRVTDLDAVLATSVHVILKHNLFLLIVQFFDSFLRFIIHDGAKNQ